MSLYQVDVHSMQPSPTQLVVWTMLTDTNDHGKRMIRTDIFHFDNLAEWAAFWRLVTTCDGVKPLIDGAKT